MIKLRRFLTAFFILILPIWANRSILRLLGHSINGKPRIGFSLIFVDKLILHNDSRIGHCNFIYCRRLVLKDASYIGRNNLIKGPISIVLREQAAIGNMNKILRGRLGLVTYGPSNLSLGKLSKITSNHYIDCTSSVFLGDFSTIAGISCQLWTHSYIHELLGSNRYRIDGSIRIGNNVYIGSACVITAGVSIASGVVIGAGTSVASSLIQSGLYVSAKLRRLDRPIDPNNRSDLRLVDDPKLSDRVYLKRIDS